MSNLYYDYSPEKYQLNKFIGKGKHGGLVYHVITGSIDGDVDSGETIEPMVLLTKEEYEKLCK